MKNKALKFIKRGNLHQILRKEIMFGLVPKTVSARKAWPFSSPSMNVLQNGSLLTDVKVLWRLETIKEFSKLLNMPNGLPFVVRRETIDAFCCYG